MLATVAKTTPEGKVKKKVTNILKFHNVWYCTPATRGMGRSGVPDYLCCHRGTFIGIEVKRDVKHLPTKIQQHELYMIQKAGGWACVIHEGNLLDLEGLLTSISSLAELTRQDGHAKLDEIQAASEAKAEEKAEEETRHLPKPDETIN